MSYPYGQPDQGGSPYSGINNLNVRSSGQAQQVGFEPGWVGGRGPELSKWRYQQMLYRDMYAARDMRAYYQAPTVFGGLWFVMLLAAYVVGMVIFGMLVYAGATTEISGSDISPFTYVILAMFYLAGGVAGIFILRWAYYKLYVRGDIIVKLRKGVDPRRTYTQQQIDRAGGWDRLNFEAFMNEQEREAYIDWQRRYM